MYINESFKKDRVKMMDLHRRFDMALRDTVEEWKKRDEVRGIFAYGSVVKGTATANSDLDLVIIWKGEEAPARLMAEHKGIMIDMDFIPDIKIEEIFDEKEDHAFTVAGVISRLKSARVEFDRKGEVKQWLERALSYRWPESTMKKVKELALDELAKAENYLEKDDIVSAVHEMRGGIFDLSRLIIMRNNVFDIIKPSEVLSNIRLLDPMMYQLLLRTFRLKGIGEGKLLGILQDVRDWLKKAVDRFEESDKVAADSPTGAHLIQAQRNYYGSQSLTLNGDYELAVLEMRRAITMIGLALLTLEDVYEAGDSVMEKLRVHESEYYEKVILEYGAFDLLPKGVQRGIAEARFMAERL